MQLTRHLHSGLKLLRVMRIQSAAVRDEAGDLPALVLIFVDIGVIQTKLSCSSLRNAFGMTIDKLFGSHTRMTVNIFFIANAEMAREIREPLA